MIVSLAPLCRTCWRPMHKTLTGPYICRRADCGRPRPRPMVKRKGTARRGPLRKAGYRKFLAMQCHCVVCMKIPQELRTDIWRSDWRYGVIDPAHTKGNGMSSKGPDSSCAPLCRFHHDLYDGRTKLPNGEVGHAAFERYFDVDMEREAAAHWKAWGIWKEFEAA